MKKQYSNEIKVGSIVRLGLEDASYAWTYSKYVNKLGRVVKITNQSVYTLNNPEYEVKLLDDKSDSVRTYFIRPSMAEIDHVMS